MSESLYSHIQRLLLNGDSPEELLEIVKLSMRDKKIGVIAYIRTKTELRQEGTSLD